MTKTKNILLSALMLMVAVLLIACGNSNQSILVGENSLKRHRQI